MSEQSQQKKGEKVSILEKFRKRLFVGTVPTKKKGEKVSILEKFRDYLSEQSHKKKGVKL